MVIVITLLSVPYALQNGHTVLYYAANGNYYACVERLLSSPGIDVDTAFQEIFLNKYR